LAPGPKEPTTATSRRGSPARIANRAGCGRSLREVSKGDEETFLGRCDRQPKLSGHVNSKSPPPEPIRQFRRLVFAAGRWFGDEVSRQICSHHQRRLRRIGWERALNPPAGGWAAGEPPMRAGNAVDVLIDGAQALPAIVGELRQARSHVHLTGWHFSPDFTLERDGEWVVLRNLLAELAERIDVRVLVWAGAPLPLFRPSRAQVRKMRERLIEDTKIECALDAKERPMHCHHEKTIVVDDRVAFVGGIDLTSESGDRFDTNEHPARADVGWHDACARIEGPAVVDVAEHFRMRWREVTGKTLAPVAPSPTAGDVAVQIVRTVPEHVYTAVPKGDFSILESYLRAIRAAERFIYIENQFLWSPEVEFVLREKIANPPHPDFRVLLLLPSKPNTGVDDTRGTLGDLIEADGEDGRLLACTLFARAGNLADRIYVHAKIAIIDDNWLTLGSANLNEHSLFNDTEMNIVSHDPDLALRTRLRLWAEHLEIPLEQIPLDPIQVIDDLWKPISKEQLQRRNDGQPLTHRLVRLPHVSRRSGRLLGPVSGILVDG
jgi:phosphatidylserine/phosphatidylglycerophosphate/cardiolipin synthase-like enzyme